MAARTGASVGVAVTITILGAMSLAFFVTTMVFYGNSQSAQSELEASKEEYKQFVSTQEREHAAIRSIRDEASRERKTVVGFLATIKSELMQTMAGDSAMGMSELRERLAGIEGAEGSSLFGLIENLNGKIDTLDNQLAASETARVAAQKSANIEAARVAQIEGDFNNSAAAMQSDVKAFADSKEQLSKGYGAIEKRYIDRIDTLRADHAALDSRLQNEMDALVQENIALQDQIARLRGEGGIDRPMPLNEEALVDGKINQVNPIDNEVMISIGRKDKAILGMTFAVYDDATDIRQYENENEEMVYPAGKAIVEIIRVEETFSRARVISASQGNPIVRGDVIANAIYDPTKTYKFVVDGLFDTDGDGVASRFERETLEALIERWGGILVSEISGDTDFVVLGEKPVLPPQPGPGAPVATIQEYVRLQQEIQRYDDLMIKAELTSMPLLNANRLKTLIGDFPN
ncbi:MAG: hypothetical protein JKX70_01795 [Phycisphaerales bacterium]|nr:hypothetical protein [Phycisphaerales bacterium]